MCGIALAVGTDPDAAGFQRMISTLAPRGEIDEVRCEPGLLAGTRRLPIVARHQAVQPWPSPDGRWLLCFNGEIYNAPELRAELTARGVTLRGGGDTEILLEAFRVWGQEVVRRLRGEYAFAIVERATGLCYLARDPLGVKPLYWTRPGRCLYLASEVKALTHLGTRIREVPPGNHGWAVRDSDPVLSAYWSPPADETALDDPDLAAKMIRFALEDSIRVRVDTDLTVGVILSGGLDSALTLLHVRQMHPDCVAFTVGAPGSEDLAYSRRLTSDLGVPHEVIELRPRDLRLSDAREAVRTCELTEYGDIINAAVSVPLFRRVRERGVKVVLTGDGSDELFGGYDMYHQIDPEDAQRLFLHKIRNLCRTELQRVDRASMGSTVEARVPFLDPALVSLAMRIPVTLKWRDGQEKWILRRAFADLLPDYIRMRPKNPMSHSSGLHERVRLYKPWFARAHRSHGYDLLGPVRRDFSATLARCDLDLDRAVREQSACTVAEHVRDLLGALRRNLIRRPLFRLWPQS
ncbi:MAG TPA: asparagine synthase-related protein [Streptosporangiaceae bacterium]|nr:asparagine synthase-related protein [Streptosporangiaceae bacterium]